MTKRTDNLEFNAPRNLITVQGRFIRLDFHGNPLLSSRILEKWRISVNISEMPPWIVGVHRAIRAVSNVR